MFVIYRTPGGLEEYLTFDRDYTTGNAFGAWTPDKTKAFGFARKEDAENFKRHFKGWFTGTPQVMELKLG